MKRHGLKGIIGEERGRTYVPSDYSTGDKGGSAGGFGVHGACGSGGGMGGMGPMQTYRGPSLGFEGGVRGGAISEPRTLPGQYVTQPKVGFDEHDDPRAEGTIHGVPGVEGPPKGHGCGIPGCGYTAKTPHGLAGHMFRKHSRKEIGQHLVSKSHGDSYDFTNASQYYRGETDTIACDQKIEQEYIDAQSRIPHGPVFDTCSSYDKGDKDGSYGGKERHGFSYP